MKKFFKNLLIFSFILIVPIGTIDIWLRNMNTLHKEKLNGLHKNSINIEVLILGNSHANYGVNPKMFSLEAYNLANVGQSIYFDRRLTVSNIKSLSKLKYVFISVDYHTLYFSSQGEVLDLWSYYASGIRYKKNNYLKEDISPFLFGYTPKVSFSLFKKAIDRKKKKVIDFDVENGVKITDSIVKGFIPFTGNSTSFNEKHYESRAESFYNSYRTSDKKEVLIDLEHFIQELKKKGVTPILFATPTFGDYNVFLNKHVILQNTKYINYLTAKYNLEYWDYSNSERFKKEDFYNCDHLNIKGANVFSKILNDRLVNYISKRLP